MKFDLKKYWKKIAGGATIIYEGVLAKYLYDLYGIFSDPMVRAKVLRGKLPANVELFPWPKIIKLPENPYGPIAIPGKEMNWIDYGIKFFYENPILQGLAIAAPFIVWNLIYYGIKRWRKDEK
jgi:hypothetical protein